MGTSGPENTLKDYLKDGIEAFLPHVSINCVVLGYRHPHLQVLLHRMPGQQEWILPGGYVKKSESLEDAAYRNLSYSGIEKVFLRQIRTFGDPHRVTGLPGPADFPKEYKDFVEWATQRFITVVYYGLINASGTTIVPGGLLRDFRWSDVDHLESMAMDHASIVEETRRILGAELIQHPIASSLMPDTFTLNELRGLFEAILDRDIDRGTFRRKILSLGIVEQVAKRKDTPGRPSHLFRFNHEVYLSFLAEETRFGF